MNGIISIYQYMDFRQFVSESFARLPNGGRGQFVKLAEALGANPSYVSMIYTGKRLMSLEHAAITASFLGLSSDETDYFIELVELDRAGSFLLRQIIARRLDRLRQSSGDNLRAIAVVK